MKKAENLISNWLEEHGDPEIERFIEKNLAITEKVRIALEEKGWTQSDFAQQLGKRPSEVTKWLSGMHNLTLKSIIKMESVLGIDLLPTQKETTYTYVYLGKIEGTSDYNEKVTSYEESTQEMQETAIAL